MSRIFAIALAAALLPLAAAAQTAAQTCPGNPDALGTARTIEVDDVKAKEWLAKGAQPSETVRRLFAEKGIMERGVVSTVKRAPKNKKDS